MKIPMLQGIDRDPSGPRDLRPCGTVTHAAIDARLAAPVRERGTAVDGFQADSAGAIARSAARARAVR